MRVCAGAMDTMIDDELAWGWKQSELFFKAHNFTLKHVIIPRSQQNFHSESAILLFRYGKTVLLQFICSVR